MNPRRSPHLPRGQWLAHSRQRPLLHLSRPEQSTAASSPCWPASSGRPAIVSMVTVHKLPTSAALAAYLQSQVAAGRTGGAGQGMSWKWAQGRGLLARPKSPVISAGDSNSCGGSAHFPVFQRQWKPPSRRRGGAGLGREGRGVSPEARPLGLRLSHNACVEMQRWEWEEPGQGLEARNEHLEIREKRASRGWPAVEGIYF